MFKTLLFFSILMIYIYTDCSSFSSGPGQQWALSRKKTHTCLLGLRHSRIQPGLMSYRDKLKYCNFVCSNIIYYAFQLANNKCVYQTARTRRLIWAFVVHIQQNQIFSRLGPSIASLLKEYKQHEASLSVHCNLHLYTMLCKLRVLLSSARSRNKC